MRRLTLLTILGALAALPPSASAQSSTAPPGNSGVAEYVETVPGATGNRSLRKPRGGENALTPAARRALEQLGKEGRATADALEATAPGATRTTSKPAGNGSPAADLGGGGDSPLRAVVEAATGGGTSSGMGWVLPFILGATLALVTATALARRRATR